MTAEEVARVQTAAIVTQYRINLGEATEPEMADRELRLFDALQHIADEPRISAREMRQTAQQGLRQWIDAMSAKMQQGLGFGNYLSPLDEDPIQGGRMHRCNDL